MINYNGTSQYDNISIFDDEFPMPDNQLPRPQAKYASWQDSIVKILNDAKEEFKRVSGLRYIQRYSTEVTYLNPSLLEDGTVSGVPEDLSRNIGLMASTENAVSIFRRLKKEMNMIEEKGWGLMDFVKVSSLQDFPSISLPDDEDYLPDYPYEIISPALADTYQYTIMPLIEDLRLSSLPPSGMRFAVMEKRLMNYGCALCMGYVMR